MNVDSVSTIYQVMDTCKQYIDKTSDINSKSEAMLFLAKSKLILGNNSDVLDILLGSLSLLKNADNPSMLSRNHFFLYVYYGYEGNIDEAYKNADFSLKEAIKSKDYNLISQSWCAMGVCYRFKQKPDSAKYAFKKSIDIYNAHEGEVGTINYTVALSNMASMYTLARTDKGRYIYPDSVLYYAHKALDVAISMDDIQVETEASVLCSGRTREQRKFILISFKN